MSDRAERDPDSAPDSFEFLGRSTPAQTVSTQGRIRRRGTPEWLAVALSIAVVAVVWFAISRPSVETETTDESSIGTSRDESADTVRADDGREPAPPDEQATTSTTAPSPPIDRNRSSTGADPLIDGPGPASTPVEDLAADGWRLLVGDGQTIVDVDLGSGAQTRHERIGAPLAVRNGRLLLYRDSRLAWSSPDDLTESPQEIVEVAALQRMFTRGRSADRPVVVGDEAEPAIWWPNNNADPQTWTRIRLEDGTVLDSIALSDTVYGGPEVVATVGSGTFERVDGRWVEVGDLFASSASPAAIVGQRCARPDACEWVLAPRVDASFALERLTIPVGGPFDLGLVADADRILLLESDGVTDHGTGRFIPMVAANATTLTAVNRANLLAMADGAGIGPRSSVVTLVDLDGSPDGSVSRIVVDDLIPRWLVLVPPPGS